MRSIMNVEKEIIKIIIEHLGVSPDEITKESSLTRDLNASQLEINDLILALQDHFKLKIPEEELANLEKVGDIITYISDHLDEPSAN